MIRQRYRSHDDSHWASISIEPGAVVVTMEFDELAQHTRLHSHAFDHEMLCVEGRALIELDGVVIELSEGASYTVEAHKQHSVVPLVCPTRIQCRHEHADIHPDKIDGSGIPMEWLDRLTDRIPA